MGQILSPAPCAILASYGMYCVTSLNQTSVVFIGVGESMRGVILYDFSKNAWIEMAETPFKINWCSCSSAHEKDYKQ